MILEVVPKGWFSNDYEVVNNGECIIDLHRSWYREEGELTIQGEKYQIQKPSMRGVFLLLQNGATIAYAEKPSAFRRTTYVDYNGVRYTLEPKSAWRRTFILRVGDQVIGSMERSGWGRKALVQMPDIPLPVVVFMTWLVIILWQRDAATTATIAATT